MFESLSDRLQDVFDQLGRKGKLTEEDVNTALREVRMALLEADVNIKVTKDFIKRVQERSIGAEVQKALKPSQQVIKIVHEELMETLGEPGRLNLSGPSPRVIMLVGLQGSGKTTTAAKLALMLRRDGRRPWLVAGDTYRPAAVDQLVTLAKQLSIPYHEEGTSASPPDICERGLKEAKAAGASVVILDTAGRLQIDDDMMRELAEIRKRTDPAEVLLVADAMTGQEAVRIAEGFNEKVGLTGLILTKVDGDARGGAAISMREVTGVPIKYMGTGEKIDAFEPFHPDRLASRILGMGDMLSLIERAEQTFDQHEAEKLQKKLLSNDFTLDDFLKQLQQVKKMGPIGQILDMLPGGGRLKQQINFDNEDAQKQMKRVEAIIYSMTPSERRNPRLLNATRKRRVAAGSGTSVQDINQLLKQFREMQRLMKTIGKGRMPKIPGMFR
ncbi:MAG TPA: signal recognition particle protein [Aggregatilinea sp.]|uniref:signal recognition particle protein n=1 Tax=Aggregatilinea sp. TaxID=2806333 RepID=UPI002C28A7E4|nr:signal recognition particle protein [Aggregatilinea sp.]HML20783.1 signal recognition particle protein [Aggregatilinea sp.]